MRSLGTNKASLLVLGLVVLAPPTTASLDADISASWDVPATAQLVFSQKDLADCLLDPVARRCVLRGESCDGARAAGSRDCSSLLLLLLLLRPSNDRLNAMRCS